MKVWSVLCVFAAAVVVADSECGCSIPPPPPPPEAVSEGSEFDESRMTRKELGYHGWALLHTMAAYFPANPSPELLDHAHKFVVYFGEVYPCKKCSRHFKEMMEEHPPVFSTKEEFMLYLCEIHNIVNKSVGNEIFDCSIANLVDRWGGDADCACGESFLAVA